ncbi:molybdopterin-guanine dinucleotide biosynthesis protein B [Metabacillus sp. RGM 3146]|uniref:molybdopterin-guanine dinucleotide biosynthesis protein B n=1 Tax=Metabacillus sp. RGM 3146 TaxID=3401092 RepID=UPI003B9AA376
MALELDLPVVQIVGYQNSGKTSLACKLLAEGKRNNWKMSSIKHHGHGGTPSLNGMKDSEMHLQAGAIAAGVEGEGVFQLALNSPGIKLDKIIMLYKALEMDVILVEGYKKEDYPKIVLLRSNEDFQLIQELNNIIAVITSFEYTSQNDSFPYFHRDDDHLIVRWFSDYIKQRRG